VIKIHLNLIPLSFVVLLGSGVLSVYPLTAIFSWEILPTLGRPCLHLGDLGYTG